MKNFHDSENWTSWDREYIPGDSFLLLHSHKVSRYFKIILLACYAILENTFFFPCSNKKAAPKKGLWERQLAATNFSVLVEASAKSLYL